MTLKEFMNDNIAPDPRERLIGRLLSNTVVIEEHLTKGLDAMLTANGVTPEFQAAVREFINPAIALLSEIEKEVISFARKDHVKESKGKDLDLER